MFHVCTSNEAGFCMACRAEGASLAPSVRPKRDALRKVRSFLSDMARCERDAHAFGLAGVSRGLVKLASAPGSVASLRNRLATYQAEVDKAHQGAVKRAKQAEKATARKVAKQASLIALRSSMALEWTVAVCFRRGAHEVRVVKSDAIPRGFSESKAARKVRGDSPALRFREAERLADNLSRKLRENARKRA